LQLTQTSLADLSISRSMMNKYTFEEQVLANEFAIALKDSKSIRWYLSIVREYEEWSLREQLEESLAVPDEEVKNNRAAIFNSRVRFYGVRKGARN
jgi:hypothetical protein